MTERLTVSLHGITCRGHHGVFADERANGQSFVVDLDIVLRSATSAETDLLGDTVDYAAVAAAVRRIVEGDPVDLIERVAGMIAQEVLADDRVAEVSVRVAKPEVRLGVSAAAASVTLWRSR